MTYIGERIKAKKKIVAFIDYIQNDHTINGMFNDNVHTQLRKSIKTKHLE